jgi:26S proteasome regulatory subunit N1
LAAAASAEGAATPATPAAAPAAAAEAATPQAAARGGAVDGDADAATTAAARQELARLNIHQSAAVIGIALITMGESIGREMAERTYQHLLQYGDVAVRRAVPLALALAHVSHPDFAVVDVLSRLTHDADTDTAMCAIVALGLVGAGTNNSRIAGLLRLLASFYTKDANPLFVVRLAQGLLHAGKGLVTMSLYHSDRTLMLKPAVAGVLTLLVCALNFKATLLGNLHYLFYALAPALRPRMVMAVDDKMQPMVGSVQIRVGTAVDVVGMAGKPKTITGFQTHASPALLGVGERAELADPEGWIKVTKVLEGAVIMAKAAVPHAEVTKA